MSKIITVGQGLYRGTTSDTLQKAVDDVAAAGGGRVEIPAGIYTMRNALRLRSGVHVAGEKGTILRKTPSICVPIRDYLGYGHYEFTVTQPERLEVGMGVHLMDKNSVGFYNTQATIVAQRGDRFFLDRMLNHDYVCRDQAVVLTLFSLVEGCQTSDVVVEGLTLDGNPEETRVLNGCRGGGVFLIQCQRVRVEDLEVTNYHGDALSFQQCTDITVRACHIHHNTGGGIHPGSGSVRYVMEHNHCHDNGGCGIFYCLRTTHSICRHNRLERNAWAGISIGERDTNHLVESNTIEGNGGPGIDFRVPVHQSGDHVRVEGNALRGNARQEGDAEIIIPAGLSDIHMEENTFSPAPGKKALRVETGSNRVSFVANQIDQRPQEPGDVWGGGQVSVDKPAALPSVGPEALPLDGAAHLNIPSLKPWDALRN